MSSQRFQSVPVQVAHSAARRCLYYLLQSRARGIIAAGLVSLGGYSASSLLAGSQSTYVCPIVTHAALRIQVIRLLNAVFDSLVLVGFTELGGFGAQKSNGTRTKRTLMSLGAGLIVSSRSLSAMVSR